MAADLTRDSSYLGLPWCQVQIRPAVTSGTGARTSQTERQTDRRICHDNSRELHSSDRLKTTRAESSMRIRQCVYYTKTNCKLYVQRCNDHCFTPALQVYRYIDSHVTLPVKLQSLVAQATLQPAYTSAMSMQAIYGVRIIHRRNRLLAIVAAQKA